MIIDELAQHIHNQGIAVLGTSLFKSYLPESPDNCIAVIETGGNEPDHYIPTKKPTFQVMIRNTSYTTGRTALDNIRSAFEALVNSTVANGSTYFYYILANAEGGHLGRDEAGRDLFSINFRCLIR